MSYSSNIPNLNDFLSLSQKQMLSNFQEINSSFFRDHVGLTEVSDVGQHKSMTFRPQSGDPTTGATQCALYNKLVSTVPQLFFRPINNGTPIQLTNSNLNTVQTGATFDSQSSFLAGPFTIYMGYVSNCPNGQPVILTPSSTLQYVGLSTVIAQQPIPSQFNIAVPINRTGSQFVIQYTFTIPVTVPPTPLPTIYYMAIGT